MEIDVIFKGLFSKVRFDFLAEILKDCKEIRLNDPEKSIENNLEQLIEVFSNYPYVDLVITTDRLVVESHVVEKVFINFTLDKKELELLLFFDLRSLNQDDDTALKILRKWCGKFKENNFFEYFICQIDNGNEDEYFFDLNGDGPLCDY